MNKKIIQNSNNIYLKQKTQVCKRNENVTIYLFISAMYLSKLICHTHLSPYNQYANYNNKKYINKTSVGREGGTSAFRRA